MIKENHIKVAVKMITLVEYKSLKETTTKYQNMYRYLFAWSLYHILCLQIIALMIIRRRSQRLHKHVQTVVKYLSI